MATTKDTVELACLLEKLMVPPPERIHFDLPFMMVPIEGNTVEITISKASSTQPKVWAKINFHLSPSDQIDVHS